MYEKNPTKWILRNVGRDYDSCRDSDSNSQIPYPTIQRVPFFGHQFAFLGKGSHDKSSLAEGIPYNSCFIGG